MNMSFFKKGGRSLSRRYFWLMTIALICLLIESTYIHISVQRSLRELELINQRLEELNQPKPPYFYPEEVAPPTHMTVFQPRYGFTEDDIYLLAQLLCGDESYDGDGEYDFVWGALHNQMNYREMIKVLCVVMNQVNDDKFPNTVREVVLKPNNYEVMPRNLKTKPHPIALEKIREWCIEYDKGAEWFLIVPEDHLYFSAGPNLTNRTRSVF